MPATYVFWIFAGVLIFVQSARAQVVTGDVREALTAVPIDAAEVFLIDIEQARLVRQTATDSLARFRLVAPDAGSYLLYVRRLGYQSTRSDSLRLNAGDTLRVTVRLFPRPIELDDLTVTAARLDAHLERAGFYDRQRQGWGHFITREEIERRGAVMPSDLLYGLPNVRVIQKTSGTDVVMRGAASTQGCCYPSIIVDGVLLRHGGVEIEPGTTLDQLVSLADLAAVEVYPGAAGLPVQYRGSVSPCGAILVWTRW